MADTRMAAYLIMWRRAPVPRTDTSLPRRISRVAEKFAGNGYLYTINSDGISHKIHDVKAEYHKAGRTYENADQKEFAVEFHIPWEAIERVEKKDSTGKWRVVMMPTKRAIEFPDEDVFVTGSGRDSTGKA